MKKKNGFTLVEILAVIIVLAVIALIVTPLITGTLKTSKDDLYETQLENIKSAAKAFMVDVDLESFGAKELVLTLEELKKTGFIEKDIKNPKTGENFNNCTRVKVTIIDKGYNYEVIESQDNDCNISNDQNNNVTMILLGLKEVTVKKGEQYVDAGILLIDNKGRKMSLENVTVDIKEKNNKMDSILDSNYNNFEQYIDTGELYEYEITYKYHNSTKVRIVYVLEDTNLECMILPTTSINEYGWITEERKAKILSINTNKNVQYSLSTINEKKYSSNQIYEIPNDGVITLYGYIKDEYGNEASCSNTLKYEIGNPSCNVNLSGTLGTNDWYKSNVTATLGVTPISNITGRDITTSNTKSYNDNLSLTLSSTNTVYGYIKDEAGKEIYCSKDVLVDKNKPTGLNLKGISTDDSQTTTKLILTATATDTESGIAEFQFYKVNGSTETLLPDGIKKSTEGSITGNTTESKTYTLSNPVMGDSYKVVVIDKAGNKDSILLTEYCDEKTVCSGSDEITTQTCTTGYIHKQTIPGGCSTTTTSYHTTSDCYTDNVGCSPTAACKCGYASGPDQFVRICPSSGTRTTIGSCTYTCAVCQDSVGTESGVEADDEELPE